ncbi:MAG: TIGR03643 family protein [Saprospiraceae bacterium]
MKIIEKYNLSAADIDRIVEMAWEDRTPFEAIEHQFGLKEAEVIQLMQHEMHPRNWRKWRARVQGRKTKHQQLRADEVNRFKSRMQRIISVNRVAKKK